MSVDGRRSRALPAGIGTIVGSAPGVLLPFLLTRWFGAGVDTDAYFLAAGASIFVASTFTIAIEPATVPHAVKARADGRRSATRLMRTGVAQIGIVVLLATVFVSLLLAFAVLPRSGFSSGQRTDTDVFMALLVPLPALAAINSMLSGIQFAFGRFVLATMSLGFRSVAALVAAASLGGGSGLRAVAVGLVVGEGLRFLVLSHACKQEIAQLPEREEVFSADGLWRTALPAVVGMIVIGVNPLVDKIFGTGLGPGAVSLLELAEKLFYTPLTLVFSAIGVVFGVTWAELLTEGRRSDAARDYWRTQRLVAAAGVAAAVTLVAAVSLVGDRGARMAGVSSSGMFIQVFALYAIGLPFALMTNVATRLVHACRATRWLPWFAVVSVSANAVLDYVGVRWIGVGGIALSSSIVRFISMWLLVLLTRGLLDRQPSQTRSAVPAWAAV
jgi:putative peptidoglycan lipid II flippase